MLAPLLLDIEDDLAATANVLRAIDGFAESVLSASLAQQAPPILWIPEVQGALNDIRAVAQQWLQVRPTVVQPLCNPFLNYTASVSALQNTLRSGATADDWMAALSALQKAARENSEQVRGVQENVATQHARFTEAHTKLQRALDDAQQGVEDALVDIQKVSDQIDALYDRVVSLGGTITGQDMATGAAAVKTSATVIYELATTAGVEVPVLSVAAVLYSIGSSVYTTLVTDAQINSTLDEIARLSVQLKADTRALAMTRLLRAMLRHMDQAYLAATQQLPRLNGYWDAEADKIAIVGQALRADVVPANMTDLTSLPTAVTVWQQIGKVANAMTLPETAEPRVAVLTIRLNAG